MAPAPLYAPAGSRASHIILNLARHNLTTSHINILRSSLPVGDLTVGPVVPTNGLEFLTVFLGSVELT